MERHLNVGREHYPKWLRVDEEGRVTEDHLSDRAYEQRYDWLLDITKKVQQAPKTAQGEACRIWRKKTFSANARSRLLAGGSLMDRNASRVAMLTLTVPGSGCSVAAAMASYTSSVINRILQVVRRSYLSSQWMYCWEFQRRGMLHLHLAIQTDSERETWRLCRRMRTMWYKCLMEISDSGPVDMFRKNKRVTHRHNPRVWQWDIQWIRKSVGAYLSKYLSKTAREKCSKGFATAETVYYPSRFWGMSRALCSEIQRESSRLEATLTIDEEIEIFGSLKEWIGESMVQTYSYQFDIRGRNGGKSIGQGFCEIFYVAPEKWAEVSSQLLYKMTQLIREVTGRNGGFSAERRGRWCW